MKKKLNKKGVSGLVGTILLIALVFIIIAIVWGIVNNLVEKGMGEGEACFGVFDKVGLNPDYTCYNSTSGEILFSISIGDINVDEILVGITAQATSKSFKIFKEESEIDNLVMYPNREIQIKIPNKHEGLTYIFDMTGAGLSGAPALIQISPIIKGSVCEVSSSIDSIENCLSLNL